MGANGKWPLVFRPELGYQGTQMEIACGQCVGCRLSKAGQWATRITHQAREHELSTFLTLTYSNHFLPYPPSLDHTHVQLFMKRLREYHRYNNPGAPKIKFFACGEYGGNTRRPHYHLIVFGLDFADKRKHTKGKRGDQIYVSKKLDELWGMGFCWIGSVTHLSAGYCARYSLKKVNGELADEHYLWSDPVTGEVFTLKKEYLACSKGLGLAHFMEHQEAMYLRDSCIIDGKETTVPSYYDRKLGELNPERLAEVKERRKQKALLRAADSTPERLAVREEVKLAQIKSLKRDMYD